MICGFYCIRFIQYMLSGKTFATNLFSLNDYKNNEKKVIYTYFKDKCVKSRV